MNLGLTTVDADAGDQLAWLLKELTEADIRGQAVWIIGHIAPSYKDCGRKWAMRYAAIIERF